MKEIFFSKRERFVFQTKYKWQRRHRKTPQFTRLIKSQVGQSKPDTGHRITCHLFVIFFVLCGPWLMTRDLWPWRLVNGIVSRLESRYRVDNKKSVILHFQHYLDYVKWKFFCNRNYKQNTISEQVLKTFGQCQNCQN